jgi:hypothetical protein
MLCVICVLIWYVVCVAARELCGAAIAVAVVAVAALASNTACLGSMSALACVPVSVHDKRA